jgi:hypothetical protein
MAEIPLDPKIIKEEIAKVKERIKEYKDYGRRGNKEDIENAKEIYEDLQEQLKELNDQLKQSQTKPAKPKVEPKQAAAKRMITKASGEQLSFSDYLKGLLGDERGAVYLPPWLTKVIQTREGPRMVDDPMTDVQEMATGPGGRLQEEDVMELKEEFERPTKREYPVAGPALTEEEIRRVKNYENIVQRNVEAERQRQILKGALMPRNQADRDRLERQANRRARQAAAEQALIDAEEVVAVQKAMQRIRNKMLRGDLGTADALQKGRPRRTLTPEQRREMIRRTNLPQTERPYGSAIDDALRRIAEEQGSEAFLRGKPDLRLVPPPVEVTDDMFIAGGPEDPPKWMQREMAERAKAEKTRKPKAKGTKILGPLGYAIDTAFIVNELADLYGDKGAAPDYSDEEKNQRLKDLIIGQMTLGLDPLVTLGETMRAQEQSGQFVDAPSWLRSLYKKYGDAPTVQETLEAELTDEELAGFRQRIEDKEATEKMRMRSKSNRMLGLEDDKLIQDTLRNLGIED